MGAEHRLWVDNQTHTLHLDGQTFPCDRDIETALPWRQYALLLSSDTDCLSLWDEDGLVRLTRVGVYPQDMALRDDTVVVCGGADGKLHLLTLPDLHEAAAYPLPGMPERVCIHQGAAYVLTLLTEPEVHTMLLTLPPDSAHWTELERFAGIPDGLCVVNGAIQVALL